MSIFLSLLDKKKMLLLNYIPMYTFDKNNFLLLTRLMLHVLGHAYAKLIALNFSKRKKSNNVSCLLFYFIFLIEKEGCFITYSCKRSHTYWQMPGDEWHPGHPSPIAYPLSTSVAGELNHGQRDCLPY